MMKNVLAANQLPVLPGLWFTADEWFAEREAKLQQVEEKAHAPWPPACALLGRPAYAPAGTGSAIWAGQQRWYQPGG